MSDITELFSRDPLQMTDEDVDQIIEEYRKKRHLFLAGGSTATKKAAGAKKTAAQEAAAKLNLDIDLDL